VISFQWGIREEVNEVGGILGGRHERTALDFAAKHEPASGKETHEGEQLAVAVVGDLSGAAGSGATFRDESGVTGLADDHPRPVAPRAVGALAGLFRDPPALRDQAGAPLLYPIGPGHRSVNGPSLATSS
jgi:hypothetical protein